MDDHLHQRRRSDDAQQRQARHRVAVHQGVIHQPEGRPVPVTPEEPRGQHKYRHGDKHHQDCQRFKKMPTLRRRNRTLRIEKAQMDIARTTSEHQRAIQATVTPALQHWAPAKAMPPFMIGARRAAASNSRLRERCRRPNPSSMLVPKVVETSAVSRPRTIRKRPILASLFLGSNVCQ